MNWQVKQIVSSDERRERRKEILKAVLVNRGINSGEEAVEFLKPRHPSEFGPEDLGIKKEEVDKAGELLKRVKNEGKAVVVYGDYDTDGVTATAIMGEFLKDRGLPVVDYIPDRRSEGYGMKVESLKKLAERHEDLGLVVTVDQGIVAYESAKYLHEKGIKLIVTDHHQQGKERLKADAVIHTIETSGSGVAWWVAEWLGKLWGEKGSKSLIELAAIGTVADLLPLLKINRSIVAHGLKRMRTTKRIGLGKLIEAAGLRRGDLEAHHISFMLAPRLNAMGRLEHADESLRLLSDEFGEEVDELVGRIEEVNKRRQELTQKMVERALGMVEKPGRLIFVDSEEFDEGVIGLVASKLVEEYFRPAIVIAAGEQVSKGSCRSIPGLNIISWLRKAEHLMEGVGGHEMAAGFSIDTKRIASLRDHLGRQADEMVDEESLIPKLEVDCVVELEDLDFGLLDTLGKLAPFGMGNPRPVVATRELRVLGLRTVGGEGKHLKLRLGNASGMMIEAIGFGMGERARNLKLGDVVDVAYNLDRNEWQGRESLEMKVKDIRVK